MSLCNNIFYSHRVLGVVTMWAVDWRNKTKARRYSSKPSLALFLLPVLAVRHGKQTLRENKQTSKEIMRTKLIQEEASLEAS